MKSSNSGVLTAVILAAGCGNRMNSCITKQQMTILGESVLFRSVKAFNESDLVDSIVVVTRADEVEWVREELKGFSKVCAIVIGGKTRAESAKLGFAYIPESATFVAIHDAARCLITTDMINAVAEAAFVHGAATAATSVTDTVKQVGEDGFVNKTLPRGELMLAQTPQIFARGLYETALSAIKSDNSITDDNMMVELTGAKVYPVEMGKQNIKITTIDDIAYAEFVLERRSSMNEIRIGHGYDVHRLVTDRKLILGGVDIPHEKGLLGHSDADVLVHAIMDAMLGACALGDIGRHFPDSDEKYRGISSLVLLEKVNDLILKNGYSLVNIDATIVIQQPKIAPHIDKMVNNISEMLKIEQSRINIKATTEEKLGFTGSMEGVSAHAVVSVKK